MCGILGFIGNLDRDIDSLSSLLKHRGPDQEGEYKAPGIHLAHKRLSILGIEDGLQPIHDSHGNVLVYNGEIYNCLELSKKYDLDLQTRNDAKILFELLKLRGVRILPELRGMFAFCFYDGKRALLARDPFGMKPLFFSMHENALEFSSELRTFESKKLKEQSVYEYLFFLHPFPGRSLLEGVDEVLPGEYLEFEPGKLKREFYLCFEDLLPENSSQVSVDQALQNSVKRHLLSDVPVGLLLSGGLDSTGILLALRDLKRDPSQCFSLAFKEREFDESQRAKEVCEYLKINQESFLFPGIDPESLKRALDSMDGPLGDASYLPTYALCEGVSKTHKVVLSGDGGDEIFYGYPTFQAEAILSGLPGFFSNLASGVGRNLGASSPGRIGFREKILRLDWPVHDHVFGRHSAYMAAAPMKFYPQESLEKSLQILFDNAKREKVDLAHPWKAVFYFYLRFYLASQVLVKTDRASMAHSLEARCPFLDVDFFRSVFQFPGRSFPYLEKPKQQLRNFYKSRLPQRFHKFTKKGFSTPLKVVLPLLLQLVQEKRGNDYLEIKSLFEYYPYLCYNALVLLYFYEDDRVVGLLNEISANTFR